LSPTPGPTGSIAAHVTHYDYTFDLDSRASHATVTAVVDQVGDCLALPFRALTTADTASATIDGEPITALDASGGVLTVCGGGDEVGATMTIDIDQSIALDTLGPSNVGYSQKTDAAGNKFHYLVSWVSGCDQFGPCDSCPDQFA